MKFETIKNKKKILLIGIILFCIGVTLILTSTLAAYKKTSTIKIAEGTINYIIPDMKIVAIYVQDEYGSYESIPDLRYYDTSYDYVVNSSKSYCDVYDFENKEWYESKDFVFNFDNNSFTFSVQGIYAKNTKCYIYLDLYIEPEYFLISDIVNAIKLNGSIVERTDFSKSYTESTTNQLFKTKDRDGTTTYYYAGNPTDNYLKYKDENYRIVRINGDGSIRVISTDNIAIVDFSGWEAVYKLFPDASSMLYSDGYTIAPTGCVVNNVSSESETVLLSAYVTEYTGYDSGYPWKGYEGNLELKEVTKTYQIATDLTCFNDSDIDSDNHTGIITYNEILLAGKNSWLQNLNNSNFATMTLFSEVSYPFACDEYGVSNEGFVYCEETYYNNGIFAKDYVFYRGDGKPIAIKDPSSTPYSNPNVAIRPVYNLKPKVLFTGSGTIDDPYVVEGLL